MVGRTSFGFLGRFGRSADLRAFDEGLRRCDVHPAQVPEGAKLAAVRLVQQFSPDATALPDAAYREAASLLAFCIQGEARLGEILGPEEAALLSHRLQAATDSEGRLDAALVLLALHAGLVSPDVRAEFSLRIVQE